ncbi:hypothetical protein HanRHA438_Chr08g0331741 [Helianthus annuus]|uniref:Uncharacterized protein n=1 Tax=Helianthus annuus TaxID=4232 RepID=A0A9K3NBL5_HELAN|nr:hypothetical protein HanXRQr2_Chr08g0320861 [Helianthus annuus]KAJ0537578.1 hypothetical protein HanHA300_Chr08g0264951 [Helianthus annuus]KAJ0545160.1 hypothetical protein HanIR_Chr08g0346391 [Helianthus annuus]KAJ0552160.1 hypothetical protein HanHA89_Chr08g0281731 [Helianthus annuus]KAJ0896210.1 hypothetical protein HanRHA438_Chr08g0331741 [Helianthus annuus]
MFELIGTILLGVEVHLLSILVVVASLLVVDALILSSSMCV